VVGRTFTIKISGYVFESTVQLRIRDDNGVIVRTRVLDLSAGAPEIGSIEVSETLDPGTYTLEAYFVSLADSSVQALDDHGITVK
jgi:hypothetical protein